MKEKKENNIWREVGPYMNLGWQMVITICLMALLGWWLDGKFDTAPWLFISLTVFGVFAGMYNFIKTVLNLDKRKEK